MLELPQDLIKRESNLPLCGPFLLLRRAAQTPRASSFHSRFLLSTRLAPARCPEPRQPRMQDSKAPALIHIPKLGQFSPGGKFKRSSQSSAAKLSLAAVQAPFPHHRVPLGDPMTLSHSPVTFIGDGYLGRELTNFGTLQGRGWAFFHLYPGSSFLPGSASLLDLGRSSLCQATQGPLLFCQGLFTSDNLK